MASRPNYPRILAVAVDTDDLDERYRNARLREFPPVIVATVDPRRAGPRGYWAAVVVLALLVAAVCAWGWL